MKRFYSIMVSIIIFCIIALILLFIVLVKSVDSRESLVGKSIVLKKDTLMILNFNTLKDTYSLENSLEIDADLIENLEIIEIYKIKE